MKVAQPKQRAKSTENFETGRATNCVCNSVFAQPWGKQYIYCNRDKPALPVFPVFAKYFCPQLKKTKPALLLITKNKSKILKAPKVPCRRRNTFYFHQQSNELVFLHPGKINSRVQRKINSFMLKPSVTFEKFQRLKEKPQNLKQKNKNTIKTQFVELPPDFLKSK